MLQTVTLFGLKINLYDFFNNLGYIMIIPLALYVARPFTESAPLPKLADLYWNKKNSSFRHWAFIAINALILIFAVLIATSLTGAPISMLFLGTSDANFFTNIFVTPVTVILLSVLLRTSPLINMDCAALITSGALVFFKIACFCWGCCNGVECERFGMLNQKTGRVEFPIQLVEAACAVVMLVILMVIMRKKDWRHGIVFPLFILMYCGSRFISEFWRDDYPDVVGPLKGYHIQCLIGLAEGIVLLVVVLKWGDRIKAFFDEKNQALLDKHAAKLRSRSLPKKKKR